MTLIVSHMNDVSGLVALSDVLISVPTNGKPKSVVLPFRPQALVHSSANYSPAGFAQKMVTADRTIIMWSGAAFVARKIIQNILCLSDGGKNALSIDEITASYRDDKKDLESIAFIYHYCQPDALPVRHAWNCEYKKQWPFDLIVSGTGEWNFFENMNFEMEEGRFEDGVVLPELLAKTLSHSVLEMFHTTSLDFLYGGWFEIIASGSGMKRKLPYVVKFWYKEKERLIDAPLFMGWYHGYDLCISRYTRASEGPYVRHVVDNTWVKDFLRRTGSRPDYPIVPSFIFHVVLSDKAEPVYSYLEPFPFNGDMTIILTQHGIRVSDTKRLRRRLLTGSDSKSSTYGNLRVSLI